ncbi:MAG: RNA methyltransferase [Acidothermales bacterium]|nr:RNA methyltransferase [Acidothermales bacterium]
MAGVVTVDDPADPRVADYVALTDVELRRHREVAEGLFVAEGEKVVRRALAAGHVPRSVLLAPRWLDRMADVLATVDAPVYVAAEDVLERISGYRVHRGPLAAMHRPALPDAGELVRAAGRVLVLEDVVDHANVGAVFRTAAAFGLDAVLLSPRCADPLYRRAVKVSMGAVLTLPWTRLPDWYAAPDLLRDAGLTVLALTPAPDALPLPAVPGEVLRRCALLLGTEGDGLSRHWQDAADLRVRIPIAAGVDSLNLAAAAAVACYAATIGSP